MREANEMMDDFGARFEKSKEHLAGRLEAAFKNGEPLHLYRDDAQEILALMRECESRLSDWSDAYAMLEMERDKRTALTTTQQKDSQDE